MLCVINGGGGWWCRLRLFAPCRFVPQSGMVKYNITRLGEGPMFSDVEPTLSVRTAPAGGTHSLSTTATAPLAAVAWAWRR